MCAIEKQSLFNFYIHLIIVLLDFERAPQNSTLFSILYFQHGLKGMSDTSWLVDIAIGLVNSVVNLPDGQVIKFSEEFKLQKNHKSILLMKTKIQGLS